MTIKPADSSQGDSGSSPPEPQTPSPPDYTHGGNKVFKSGPLYLSSKGIGWTSWKKRWFILTRTSLVFFRSDPSVVLQKGSEVNLTLGGIDLNNTGSVVVKSDKKLLTVLFPDGRDGRAFTLKAETMEDLYEWKFALEEALAEAPSGTYVTGQNGAARNDSADAVDGTTEQSKEKQQVKSLVVGRPILLALEDVDGTPSFLEKALQFVEDHGVKVEGILRQAADVEDVEHRIREYEKGKTDFSPDEDGHVIADCVKYVLRELPSSPVPASCCKALLEACRTDRSKRLAAIREAICETFPEPNRKLLQRILSMMQAVASHKDVNRMSSSAVAACMAPLLLRPLLAGDCDLDHDFDLGSDGSIQLMQAAAAANHAQTIVITLLEEYESIFGGGVVSTELYSDTEESGSGSDEFTDDDGSYDDDESYDDDDDDDDDEDGDDGTENSDVEDLENASDGTHTHSYTGDSRENCSHNNKESNVLSVGSKSHESEDHFDAKQKSSSNSPKSSVDQHDNMQSSDKFSDQCTNSSAAHMGCDSSQTGLVHKPNENPSSNIQNSTAITNGPAPGARRPAVWGRTPGKKNLSMESIEVPLEDLAEIEKLEMAKMDLQNKITEEAKGNTALQANLEKRKKELYERRLALKQDVARLKEQLQKERELRAVLEAGINNPQGSLPVSFSTDEKTKADIEEIARIDKDVNKLHQTARVLGDQLSQQREQNYASSNSAKEDSSHQSNLNGKGKNAETKATLHSSRRLTRNEGSHHFDHRMEIKQQLDSLQTKKSHSMTSTSFIPKKSVARGEGAIPTSSTLSKLTNRLNFSKERRSQVPKEIDKNRGPDSYWPNSEGDRGPDRDKFHGLQVAVETKGHQFENTDVSREHDIKSNSTLNVGRSNDQHSPNLERGKSESFPTPDNGRRPDSLSLFPPRTLSR